VKNRFQAFAFKFNLYRYTSEEANNTAAAKGEQRFRAVTVAAKMAFSRVRKQQQQQEQQQAPKNAKDVLSETLKLGPAAELDDIFDEWADARAAARAYRTPPPAAGKTRGGASSSEPGPELESPGLEPGRGRAGAGAEAGAKTPEPEKSEQAAAEEEAGGAWQKVGRRLRLKDQRQQEQQEPNPPQKAKEKMAWGGGRPANENKKNSFKAAALAAKLAAKLAAAAAAARAVTVGAYHLLTIARVFTPHLSCLKASYTRTTTEATPLISASTPQVSSE
jgi:hypothetical protein